MKKILLTLIFLFSLIILAVYFGNSLLIWFENDDPSQSIGSTSSGKLINGKRLPTKGVNFTAYSYIGVLLGRNSVHHEVRKVILETYGLMQKKFPAKKFVYGETGWPGGGKFAPHKTHQNGLSVDFMVPILNKNSKSAFLPTSIFNKFGYDLEFDSVGKTNNFDIDFEALAAHIFYLHQTAKQHDMDIWRVIFDPQLQAHLFKTEYGRKIEAEIQFSKKSSWIRHDEHYHVDFRLKKL